MRNWVQSEVQICYKVLKACLVVIRIRVRVRVRVWVRIMLRLRFKVLPGCDI